MKYLCNHMGMSPNIRPCREKAEDNEDIVRDSYKGKQFLPSCSKSGRTPDTYFGLDKEKKHLYIAEVNADLAIGGFHSVGCNVASFLLIISPNTLLPSKSKTTMRR